MHLDTSSNFHPYECDGPGRCIHCDRRKTKDHDPVLCALCDPDYDHAPNPAREREEAKQLKTVLYNNGGHVAHIAVKIHDEDTFNAFCDAANIAAAHEGQVEALYRDNKFGSRVRVGAIEKAGLVLEFGSLDDRDELARELDRLYSAVREYLEHDPRQKGHAEAHRKLREAMQEEK